MRRRRPLSRFSGDVVGDGAGVGVLRLPPVWSLARWSAALLLRPPTVRITQDPIIRAQRLPTAILLIRPLPTAILRRSPALPAAIPSRRPALPVNPLETLWPTACSATGHIIRKPEPILGPTANVILAPERQRGERDNQSDGYVPLAFSALCHVRWERYFLG